MQEPVNGARVIVNNIYIQINYHELYDVSDAVYRGLRCCLIHFGHRSAIGQPSVSHCVYILLIHSSVTRRFQECHESTKDFLFDSPLNQEKWRNQCLLSLSRGKRKYKSVRYAIDLRPVVQVSLVRRHCP